MPTGHLLRCSTDECLRVKQMIEVGVDWREVRVVVNSLYEVIFSAMFLDHRCCSL